MISWGMGWGSGSGGAVDPSAGYALYLPFSAASPTYRVGSSTYSPVTTLPGYSYTRSGAKSELNASGSPVAFAANVAGIVPGVGYWSRGALTNLMLQSQAFDDAGWNKLQATVTANSIAAPDGTTTADTLAEDTTTNTHLTYRSVTHTAAQHTTSIFAKMGTQRYISLRATKADATQAWLTADLQAGTVTSNASADAAYIINCGNGWYRCVLVYTPGASTTDVVVALSDVSTAPGTANTLGNSYLGASKTAYIWQAQTILGNHPAGGPIIVTAGATASLGADVLAHTQTAPTDVDQVFFAKINHPAPTGIQYVANLHDGTDANRIILYLDAGVPTCQISVASVSQHSATVAAITASQDTILVVRRLAGNWRFGKVVAGVLTWAASAAGTFPTGMVNNAIGMRRDSIAQLDGVILNDGHKVGTFSTDAEVIAAVSI